MKRDPNYSIISNFLVCAILIGGGTLISATMIVVFGGAILYYWLGHPFTFLSAPESIIGYGVLGLGVLHLITRGWWVKECYRVYEEAMARHEQATARRT